MNRAPILAVALLLNSAPQLLLGTALSIGGATISVMPARAQSAEAVAKIAQAITVRIEGATQGSGVLVKRDGNRYTVLTAWHVVSGQRPGEEIGIYTADGKEHKVEKSSVERLGNVDMAILTFQSQDSYNTASIADNTSVLSSRKVYIAGFPNSNGHKLAIETGEIQSRDAVGIDSGYQLLYSTPTQSGMSGGPVLLDNGKLIGIHGRGDIDVVKREYERIESKTGINQGIPIIHYEIFTRAGKQEASTSSSSTSDDEFLRQARALYLTGDQDLECIKAATKSLAIKQSAEAYFIRANARQRLRDLEGAIADYSSAITLDPKSASIYANRGAVLYQQGESRQAMDDFDQSISLQPTAWALANRAIAKMTTGDKQGAIKDLDSAIEIDPKHGPAYSERGSLKLELNDTKGALSDHDSAVLFAPSLETYANRGWERYKSGDHKGAISDYTKSLSYSDSRNWGISSADMSGRAITFLNRGNALSDQGDYRSAISDYSQAILLSPSLANAWGARSVAKSKLGDFKGACYDMRKASLLGSQEANQYLPTVCK